MVDETSEDTVKRDSSVRSKFSRLLITAVQLLAGAAVGALFAKFMIIDGIFALDLSSAGLIFAALVPIAFFVILIHELGHVIGN